jgi:hypothetical protein
MKDHKSYLIRLNLTYIDLHVLVHIIAVNRICHNISQNHGLTGVLVERFSRL